MNSRLVRQEWYRSMKLRVEALKGIIDQAFRENDVFKAAKFWRILRQAEQELEAM